MPPPETGGFPKAGLCSWSLLLRTTSHLPFDRAHTPSQYQPPPAGALDRATRRTQDTVWERALGLLSLPRSTDLGGPGWGL